MPSTRNVQDSPDARVRALENALDAERAARRRAEARLEAALEQQAMLLEAANVGLYDWDVTSGEVAFSREWMAQLGLEQSQVGPAFDEFSTRLHPDDLPGIQARLREALDGPETRVEREFRLRHEDGSYRHILAQSRIFRDADGRAVRVMGSHIDVTDARGREADLARSEAQLRDIVALSPVAVGIFRRGRLALANAANARLRGYDDPEAMVGLPIEHGLPAHLREPVLARVEALERDGTPIPWTDVEIRRRDGTSVQAEFTAVRASFEGEPSVLVMARDVSEQRARAEVERALFALSARLVDASPESIDATIDEALGTLGTLRDVDRCYLFRYDPTRHALDNTHEWCRDGIEPQITRNQGLAIEDLPWFHGRVRRDRSVHVPALDALPPEAGRLRQVLAAQGIRSLLAVPVHVGGRLFGFVGFDAVRRTCTFGPRDEWLLRVAGDLIAGALERVRTEEALRTALDAGRAQEARLARSVALLEQAERIAGLASWYFDPALPRTDWSAQMFAIYGFDPAAGVPPYEAVAARYEPGERARVDAVREAAIARGEAFDVTYTIVDGEGRRRRLRTLGEPDPTPGPAGYAFRGVTQDVTAEHEAAEARERLQQQLLHAQKMESVGRLAGGIAHDFNNMLGVILGNVSIALEEVPPDAPVREDLREIEAAARRSEELTRTLLAFGRRQRSEPRVVDLRTALGATLTMLRRLIREDVQLSWTPAPDLWPVRIDPAQLDQILVNLGVNARDAIDGAGAIALEARNVTLAADDVVGEPGVSPGDFVRLTVRDDGCGMDAATAAQVFEPFFTTKGVGAGTGLGLSTVYGLVRQHGGFLRVDSAVGQGSAFHVCLPRADGEHASMAAPDGQAAPAGRGEAVLLVEDEPALLRLTARALERLGYRVHACLGPREAMARFAELGGAVQLLLSDVVMPDMDGGRLAEALRVRRPELRVLFMSGYAADVLGDGAADPGAPLLGKPFTTDQLAHAVRDALDAPPR